jgi:hypothetical protein
MRLRKTYFEVRIDNPLPGALPIQKGLQKRDAQSSLLFSFGL